MIFPGVYALGDCDTRMYRGTHDPYAALAGNTDIDLQYLVELYPFNETKRQVLDMTAVFPGVQALGDYKVKYAGGEEKERLSDRGFITKPTDSDPNRIFLGRVTNALQFDSTILSGDGFSGGSSSYGGIDIVNADGSLDRFFDYHWSGRRIAVKAGALDFGYGDFAKIFEGSIDNIEGDDARIVLTLRDNRIKTDKPVKAGVYGGTGGLDGMMEMAGIQKPLAYGVVRNMAPVLVQYSTLTYQVHDGAIGAVTAVRDKGIVLTNAGDVADITLASPGASQFMTQLSGGYIKLGSTPAGQVTADIQGDAAGSYTANPVTIASRVLTKRLGVYALSSTDMDSGSLTSLAAVLTGDTGIYITDGMTGSDVLDALLNGQGAFWTFTRQGLLFAGSVAAPGAALGNVERIDTAGLTLRQTISPSWRIKVGYGLNQTVQGDSDLAGAVTQTVRNFVTQEYRYLTYENANVRLKNSAATERVFYTGLADQTAAQALLDRLVAVYSTKRMVFQVPVYKTLYRYFLGDVVNLTYDRYGLQGGRNFMVAGVSDNAATGQTVLTLWG